MAEEPKYWRWEMPNGDTYDAPGETQAESYDALQAQIAGIVRQQHLHLPLGQRLLSSVDSAGRILADSAFGLGDRFASAMPGSKGYEAEKYETEKRRMEVGGGTEMDVLGAIGTAPLLPTAVPRVTKWLGGPKDVKFIAGLITSALENAGYGAADAAMHGDDVQQGAAVGGAFGAGGHAIAQAIGAIPGAARWLDEQLGGRMSRGAKSAADAIGLKGPRVRPVDPGAPTPSNVEKAGVKIGEEANMPAMAVPEERPGPLDVIPLPPPAAPPAAPPVAPPPPAGPLAQGAPAMPPVAPPVAPAAVPAGPLVAPKAEPKRLTDAKAGLVRSQKALADVDAELANPNLGLARRNSLAHQKTALTNSIDRHTKTIDKLSAAPSAPTAALVAPVAPVAEAAPPAAPPVAPAGPLAAEPAVQTLASLQAQREVIDRQLSAGNATASQRQRLGATLKELDDRIANFADPAPKGVLADPGPRAEGTAGTPEEQAIAQKKYDDADARLARAHQRFLADKNPKTAAALEQADKDAKLAHAANLRAKGIVQGKATAAPLDIVPRKAAAGTVEPNQPQLNKAKPGTKTPNPKATIIEGTAGAKTGKSKAEREKERAQQKRQATPEELRAIAEGRVEEAIKRAQVHAAGPNSHGFDKAIGTQVEGLLNDRRVVEHLSSEELDALQRINKGDPAMKGARFAGHLASLPSVISSGIGGMSLAYAMNPLVGLATFPGIPALGMYGRSVADRGAKKLTNEMMDLIKKRTPAAPAVDPKNVTNLYKILRNLGL